MNQTDLSKMEQEFNLKYLRELQEVNSLKSKLHIKRTKTKTTNRTVVHRSYTFIDPRVAQEFNLTKNKTTANNTHHHNQTNITTTKTNTTKSSSKNETSVKAVELSVEQKIKNILDSVKEFKIDKNIVVPTKTGSSETTLKKKLQKEEKYLEKNI